MTDLTADFLIGKIRVQEGIELRFKEIIKSLIAGHRVEMIDSVGLGGPGAAVAQGHVFQSGNITTLLTFAQKQVFAGMGLAHVGAGRSLYPEKALRYRLNF